MLTHGGSLFLMATLAFAAKVPTIDQALSTQSVAGAEISPDGKFVAYTVTQANWEENDFISQIWIASTATGERYRLTSGKKSSSGAQWSPDSKRLAFTSDRDGKRQIYLISPTGGEASALTAEENGVGGFGWSPDGAWIAFTSSGPDAKWKKDRKEKYGEIDVIGGDYQMSHLWRVKVPAEMPYDAKTLPKPEALTKGAFTVSSFSYSPDGARIAFTGARDPDLGSQGTQQIYVLDLADLHVRKLLDTGGPNSNPKWSPDGKHIAYVTANGQEFYFYANRYIATIPAEGGTPRVITSDFDEDPNLVDWSADGIYFTALQKTAAHAFRIDPATKAIKRISGPDAYHLSGVSFTKDHRAMAGTGAMPNHFAEIITSSTSDFVPKLMTEVAAQYKDFKLATREVVEWTSSDGGAKMEGILIKPADYDPSRKYPLMVVIHGGPTGVDTPILSADRYYPVEMFAAKGALILKPNYRGSAGYGAKFRALNVRDLGTGDYADVISGVDSLIANGLVDKDRVASMGWSEGGYISAFITCFSDRFKAVSVGAGISDWMTYYVNTDIHPFTRQYLKATPWDDPEIYRKTSPITYVNKAKTPTLIQQGDQDKRVPPPNSYELYQALKDRGIPVRLVFYKGFGHPINKPKQQRSVIEENYAWFSRYIWGEENQ